MKTRPTKQLFSLLAVAYALPLAAQDTALGRQHFADYCAACHGVEARGDGPMEGVLFVPPTDLTRLAAESGGRFPVAEVVAKVDGRNPLLAHGSEMPVYGPYFEGKGVVIRDAFGAPIMTSQPIIDIVSWLKTIQE